MKWNKQEEVKSILEDLLSVTWFWNVTKQLLDFKGTISKNDLRDKLGYESKADPERHTVSLSFLINYMIYSGLVKEQDGNLTYANRTVTNQASIIINETPKASNVQPIVDGQKSNNPTSKDLQTQLVIGVLINPDMSEEQIRNSIRIIVDEWKKLRAEIV